MEEVYKDYRAVKERFTSETVPIIDQNRPKWLGDWWRPSLKHRPTVSNPFPPTIDPNNWTEVTSDEKKAQGERLAIRGRLRRHFYKLMYHPEHHKHFNSMHADPALNRFVASHEVYFKRRSYSARLTSKEWLVMGAMIGLPLAYCYYILNNPKFLFMQQQKPVLDPLE